MAVSIILALCTLVQIVHGQEPSATGKLRVNCGGNAIGDIFADQKAFHAETGNIGKYSQRDPSASVYNSMAFQKTLIYTFLVTPGSLVTVTAQFAETYGPAESTDPRVMNVSIGGREVETVLNVAKKAGGLFVPYDITTEFTTTNGLVEVKCVGVKQNAMISGIEVVAQGLIVGANGKRSHDSIPKPLQPTTSTPSTLESNSETAKVTSVEFVTLPISLHINCGGPAIGMEIVADSPTYTAKMSKSPRKLAIGDPTKAVSNSIAIGDGEDLVYTFNVTEGAMVKIRATFAEISDKAQRKGARVMDVEINSAKVVEKLDVFGKVGLNKTFDVPYEFRSSGTTAEIRIKSVIGDPIMSAIYIEYSGGKKKRVLAELESAIPQNAPVAIPVNPDDFTQMFIDLTN